MTKFQNKYGLLSICLLLAIFGLIAVSGCRQVSIPQPEKHISPNTADSLIEVNKQAIGNEDAKIRGYISRMGLNMKETGTGLRYLITEKGNGPQARAGKIAHLEFETRLISGELCYSSHESGPKEFRIGSGGVESGLEEGILLLHKGDRAKFILPSHLAFGLIGDQDKIPGRCPIVYDVHLIDLN